MERPQYTSNAINSVDLKLLDIGIEQLEAGEYRDAIDTFLDLQDRYPDNLEIVTRLTQAKCLARLPFLRPFVLLGDGWVCRSPIKSAVAAVISLVVLIGVITLAYRVITPGSPETPVPLPSGTTESHATVALVITASTETPLTSIEALPIETTEIAIEAPTEVTERPTEAPTEVTVVLTEASTEALAPESPPPPPPPPPRTPAGKIAVPVFDTKSGTYNVYIARASDGWRLRLFFQNGSQPAFSPNGRQIILRSWRLAEQGYGQRLVLFPSLKTGTGDERLMTQNMEDAHPSLNCKDDIVFHTRSEGSPIVVTLGTWPGAENDIANQHKLGLGENPDWLEYRIGGRCSERPPRIIYYAPGPPPGLYIMNAGDNNPQLVLGEQGPLAPAAAPDGDHMAVSLIRGDYWHVFALSVSQGSGSLAQLTNESADDRLPVWSTDGHFIAFVSNRGGKWAVWVMNADGTDQRKLFDMNGSIDGEVSIALDMSQGWGEERLSWAP